MDIFKLKFFGNITWLGDFFVGKRIKIGINGIAFIFLKFND